MRTCRKGKQPEGAGARPMTEQPVLTPYANGAEIQGPVELIQKVLRRQEELALCLDQLRRELGRPEKAYFTIREAMAYTGLSRKHIGRAVKRGELSCSNVATEGAKKPTYRIARRNLDAWMEANAMKQAPAKRQRDALAEKYFGKRPRRQQSAA